MRLAYADPPYPGCAGRYPEKREVDHAALITSLCADFPDGWALSSSSPALRQVLPLCPDDARIAAWCKPFAIFKPGVGVAYAWEPVIFRGGRRRSRRERTAQDWIAANVTLHRGTVGAKPRAFCMWLFDLLGARPSDDFVDLFPGSGAVTEAWRSYRGEWNAQGTMWAR